MGLGRFGRLHAETLRGLPGCRLAAICDADPELLERCGDAVGRGRSLPRPRGPAGRAAVDAVDIVTGEAAHGRHARLALEAGRAVFVEKPLATRLDEAEAVQALAEATGLPVLRRQHLALRRALRVPAAGVRGRPLRPRRAGERAADVLPGLVRRASARASTPCSSRWSTTSTSRSGTCRRRVQRVYAQSTVSGAADSPRCRTSSSPRSPPPTARWRSSSRRGWRRTPRRSTCRASPLRAVGHHRRPARPRRHRPDRPRERAERRAERLERRRTTAHPTSRSGPRCTAG